jgi:hypothetical protein
MKRVKVSGRLGVGKYIIVDDEDYAFVRCFKWWMLSNGYAYTHGRDGKTLLVHRLVLMYEGKEDIDHINRNKLDCRRGNLRICTKSENMMNTALRKNNRSGHPGIHWSELEKRWKVRVKHGERVIHSTHRSLKKALRARKDGVSLLYGKFKIFEN